MPQGSEIGTQGQTIPDSQPGFKLWPTMISSLCFRPFSLWVLPLAPVRGALLTTSTLVLRDLNQFGLKYTLKNLNIPQVIFYHYKPQFPDCGFIVSPWVSQEDNALITMMSKDTALKSKSKPIGDQNRLLPLMWGQQAGAHSPVLSGAALWSHHRFFDLSTARLPV